MDHQASSLILSSNAPPSFHENEVSSFLPYRVLQEACGNKGIENDHNIQYPKADYTQQSENGRTNLQRGLDQISDDNSRRETSRLLRHLTRCPRYMKYRGKQPSSDDEEVIDPSKTPWPDHIEFAFWQGMFVLNEAVGSNAESLPAVLKYPPMGKRKRPAGSASTKKLRGRNELISEEIHRLTGETRTRKQISSHIQTLRPKVKEDEFGQPSQTSSSSLPS